MTRGRTLHAVFLFAVVACACVGMVRGEPQPALTTSIVEQAASEFRDGAARIVSDPGAAQQRLRRSIALYESLAREHGVRNGPLYYNIGNAHLLLGEIGRAVLNYERARAYMPNDPNLRANLDEARRRIARRIEAPAPERFRRALFFWHDQTSPRLRWAIFSVAWAVAWLWAGVRLLGFARGLAWWPAILSAAVALTLLTSLAIDAREHRAGLRAIVVTPDLVGRRGPDAAAYEPTFKDPLPAGLEVRIVEPRSSWLLVRLADGRETWVPEQGVERVHPR